MVIDGDSINTVEANPVFFPILQKQQLWNLENIHNMESWNPSITAWNYRRMADHLSVACRHVEVDFLYPEFNGSAAIPLHSTPTEPSWVDLKVVEVGKYMKTTMMGPWGGFRWLFFFFKKMLSIVT